MSRDRDPTEPTKCRSCNADILWADTFSGKKMPVDYPHDSRGDFVLAVRGDRLVVEKFYDKKHDPKRNRYTSHFATCPNADEHRKAR